MLQELDEIQLYNQMDGCHMCIFLDADNSHLNLPLLQYTNNEGHKWDTFISVPYGTHIW